MSYYYQLCRQHFLRKRNLVSFVTGEAFDTTQPIHYAVSNIICSMVYGSRYEYDDPQFTYLVDDMSKRVKLAGSPLIQVSFYIFVKLLISVQ